MPLEIVPFGGEHLAGAGELLAERHRRHREAEPLLAARYERAEAAAAEVEALLARPGAAGAAGLRKGRLVAYLVGVSRDDETWGPNVWVEAAGHAVREAEDIRDLYAAAAAGWVQGGRTRHYAVVPAADLPLVDAWSRLGFGQQHALAVADVPADAVPAPGVREAGDVDFDVLVELAPLLEQHQAAAPVFSGLPADPDLDEVRLEIAGLLAEPGRSVYVAEEGGTITGALYLAPCDASSMHAGLAGVGEAGLLAWIAVRPERRGAGTGSALTQTAFAWARARGHAALAIDWRVTNLEASRFWPRRGFRTTFLRLYRSIP